VRKGGSLSTGTVQRGCHEVPRGSGCLTVAESSADWLKAVEPTIRPSSFESYERNMRNNVIGHTGTMPITKIEADVLNGGYTTLLSTGREPSSRAGLLTRGGNDGPEAAGQGLTLQETADYRRNEFTEAERLTKDTLASLLRRSDLPPTPPDRTGLDPRTVDHVHTIPHRAFKDAVRWVASHASRPTRPIHRRLARRPTTSKPGTLRQATRSSNNREPPTIVSSGCGRHWSRPAHASRQAVGLRWKDVDLDKGKAHVVQAVIQIARVSQSEPETVRGRRPVKLNGGTVAILRDHRKRMLEERLLVGPDFVGQRFRVPPARRLLAPP
jgi:hypothetical protein